MYINLLQSNTNIHWHAQLKFVIKSGQLVNKSSLRNGCVCVCSHYIARMLLVNTFSLLRHSRVFNVSIVIAYTHQLLAFSFGLHFQNNDGTDYQLVPASF